MSFVLGDRIAYRYRLDGLRNGFKYFVAATAYDLGTNQTISLESGIAQNKTLAIPGPAPGERSGFTRPPSRRGGAAAG